ncbi:LysR family transcriptional regulator [Paracoccus sp. Z118]|uniref:LysR family transcriptional regulator n=1 Tax=Paracoccus sp. Z118 TaxID=2851017 RepID=UPI001C2C983F|nr:LysR family transcriptional regulator [Paracoccus sp. Z118]MBV0891624.1 LysR family transcriptional regulator [Paracoccus sp. Z118]
MLDRFTGLQVFSRVAALGSLSAAARALGMSQTMASKHMTALEDRLGVKLVHRTTRKVTLTEAGQRYLDSAERILEELERADAFASAERVEVTGTLRVNAPVSFGVRVLAPMLPDLAARHPALRVDLALNDRPVDLVGEGWDVAVRVGLLRQPDLIARRLAPCRTSLAAAPAYLAAHGAPERVADLAGHNCLDYTLSQSVGGGQWRFGPDESVKVAVTGNLQANNGDALLMAARAGQGIVYQPTFILGDDFRAGTLVPLTLDHPPAHLHGVFAVYPMSRRPPARLRAFVDWMAERCGPVPPWDRNLAL